MAHDQSKTATAAEQPDPAKALDAAIENFTSKFKNITPDQQVALNNLRDALDAAKAAKDAPKDSKDQGASSKSSY